MGQRLGKIDAALSTLVSQDSGEGDTGDTQLRVNQYGALWVQQSDSSGVSLPTIAVEETVLASAARTVETTSSTFTNTLYQGVIIVFDWTTEGGTSTLTPRIEGLSSLGTNWYTILQGAGLTATGTTVLRVYPTMTASANLIAVDFLPPSWRVVIAVGTADSNTYSVNSILLP